MTRRRARGYTPPPQYDALSPSRTLALSRSRLAVASASAARASASVIMIASMSHCARGRARGRRQVNDARARVRGVARDTRALACDAPGQITTARPEHGGDRARAMRARASVCERSRAARERFAPWCPLARRPSSWGRASVPQHRRPRPLNHRRRPPCQRPLCLLWPGRPHTRFGDAAKILARFDNLGPPHSSSSSD